MEKFGDLRESSVDLSEAESKDFIAKGIGGQATLIARYSLSPTPTPDIGKGTDEEVADFLAQVEVDDRILSSRVQQGFGKGMSADSVFEAASLTVAKAKHAAEEARGKEKSILARFGDKIANKVSEAIVKIGGKKALVATSGLALMATACSARVAPTISPETAAPQVATMEATPTEAATPTPEPSPTPEIITGDPREVSSWPERYQNYFAHPDPATWEEQGIEVTDAQFDEYLNTIRRNYLTEKGIEGAGEMSPEDLLWAMVEESAKEQREIILSPSEIIGIVEDERTDAAYHWRWLTEQPPWYVEYGFWAQRFGNNEPGSTPYVDNTEGDLDRVNLLNAFNYQTTIFGREATVPRWSSGDTAGDLAGVVELPGESGQAVLIRLLDTNLDYHLIIQRIVTEPLQFDETMRCVGVTAISYTTLPCPSVSVETKLTEKSGNWATDFKSFSVEELLGYLEWPPRKGMFISPQIFESRGFDPVTQQDAMIEGYIDPDTGLELMARMILPPNWYNPSAESIQLPPNPNPTTTP
jgi:hypothetical protein